MRRLMMVGLMVSVLLGLAVQPAPAFQIRKADCESIPNYLQHNAQGFAMLGGIGMTVLQAFLGGLGAQPPTGTADVPDAFTSVAFRPKVGVDFVGLGLAALKSSVYAGISPIGIPNLICGFFCCELVWSDAPAVSLDVGTAGVSVEGP